MICRERKDEGSYHDSEQEKNGWREGHKSEDDLGSYSSKLDNVKVKKGKENTLYAGF